MRNCARKSPILNTSLNHDGTSNSVSISLLSKTSRALSFKEQTMLLRKLAPALRVGWILAWFYYFIAELVYCSYHNAI
jgi:hypothetical protein